MAKLIFTTQETVLEIMDDNEFISFEMKTKIENNTQLVYLNKDDKQKLFNDKPKIGTIHEVGDDYLELYNEQAKNTRNYMFQNIKNWFIIDNKKKEE